ncbi:MAG: hypothetical protein FJ096_21030 [Deltaproteobacteria bacterium]|nr:hypothetical protein [Deltaproteobacteria bacterium]
MKYKHFRAIVVVGALVVGGLGLRACGRWLDSEPDGASRASAGSASEGEPRRATSDAPRSGSSVTSTPGDPAALRPIDGRILERVRAGVASDKVKDAFPGERIKVNLYNESGKIRAKVDLDRDDKWDEKWDFESEDGKEVVKRRVSTADDDATYDVELRLREGRWVAK